MWIALAIIVLIGLICFRGSRNAVWGSATIGLIGGLIAAAIIGFAWTIVGKWIISAALIGIAVELLGRFSHRNSN